MAAGEGVWARGGKPHPLPTSVTPPPSRVQGGLVGQVLQLQRAALAVEVHLRPV